MEQSAQATSSTNQPIPYTIHSARKRRMIILLLGLTTLASPLTATIYLPLLPLLQDHFHTSAQAINPTITIYIVAQALAPTVLATLSDSTGRRVIYLTTFTIYLFANVNLALNRDSYALLLVLRGLQSVGASSVASIAYGIISDVCVPAERGKMLGPVMAVTNLGNGIGPLIGGFVVVRTGGYQWVFWDLVIFAGLILGAIGVTLPETSRSLVGNGSIEAVGWQRTWWVIVRTYVNKWRSKRHEGLGNHDAEMASSSQPDVVSPAAARNPKPKLGNPLASLRIIFYKDVALALWLGAFPYTIWACWSAVDPDPAWHVINT